MNRLKGVLSRLFGATVRRQLIWGVALVHAVMMSLFVFDLSVRQRDFLIESQTSQAFSLARNLSLIAVTPLLSSDYAGLQELTSAIGAYPGVVHVMVILPSGKIVAHGQPDYRGQYAADFEQISRRGAVQGNTLFSGSALADVAVPVVINKDNLGWVRVGVSQSANATKLAAITYSGLLYTALAIAVGILLAWFLANRLTRRMSRLALTADEVRAGNTQLRAEVVGQDELSHLAHAINFMLDNLEYSQRKLRREEATLSAVLDNVGACIYLKDIHGKYLFVNRQVLALWGTTLGEVVGFGDEKFFDTETVEHLQLTDRVVMVEGTSVRREESLTVMESGRALTYWSVKIPLCHPDGSIYGLCGISTDISDRKQAEKKLELAASVFSHAREGIIITDAGGAIIDVNDAFTHITGYSREDALGQNPRMLKSDRQGGEFYAGMWTALNTRGHWSGEIWNRRKGGQDYPQLLTISAVRDANAHTQHYIALFSDISATIEHQLQLEQIARYDPLTSLPNRLLFADRLGRAINQCQRRQFSLAVAYLDLDNFKAVNDQHGHNAGDALLIQVSMRMQDALREGDTLARIGGDEFVAVIVDLVDPQDCLPVIERLRLAATVPITVPISNQMDGAVGDLILQVSASIGVAFYPQDGVEADQLIRRADQAMYLAKQAGRNRIHLFDIEQDKAIQSRHASLEQIRKALDNEEFVLHYQPKVNMKSGRVTGVEALIRWQHGIQGLLAPAAFLPIIEGHPMSDEVGDWVIATALDQMEAWHEQGFDLPASINIGARQLQQQGFALKLIGLLASHPNVKPHYLQLEVLETSALEDIHKTGAVMDACQAAGVSFALDDFGTGYSSLSYLKNLPAETLKIDRSFVRDMLVDSNDLAIVTGVIGLAKAFGREVIAEGVETAAHGELLLSMGCELAQGFGIARPMPAADLPGWVARWHADAVWMA